MYFKLILLVLGVFALWRDFNRDPGQHLAAKGIQVFFVLGLLLSYGGSIGYALNLLFRFEDFRTRFSSPVGAVPGNVHLVLATLHIAVCLVTIILTYQLESRQDRARRLLCYVLPLLTLFEAFNFQRGWLQGEDTADIPQFAVYLLGVVLYGILVACFVILYNTEFMRSFFAGPPLPAETEWLEPALPGSAN
ncbi:hypothetical protein [Hymenobacter cellulosilyticus]|uniref:Uncharacterized protein n=1 Tax=Hymenobacter cellulosilyticus TaxID=2932248 RepID=A0A8T9PZ42_9BACT|nr:hypothetical protein [Hymenobacter cellulosilyticus]UOQ70504.1 hypothetical protein MUN79_17455 [Hymenobacter cellulosilyticus]